MNIAACKLIPLFLLCNSSVRIKIIIPTMTQNNLIPNIQREFRGISSTRTLWDGVYFAGLKGRLMRSDSDILS